MSIMPPIRISIFEKLKYNILFHSYYAGKCLYLSGLISEPLTAYDDYKLKDYGIGFTNIVERTSRGSADLTRCAI